MPDGFLHYVYTYAYPAEMGGSVFYVGKGSTWRIQVHEWEAKGACECRKCMVIRSIWEAGHEVVKLIVFESYDPDLACDRERELIQFYGPHVLVNKQGYKARPKPLIQRQAYLDFMSKVRKGSVVGYYKPFDVYWIEVNNVDVAAYLRERAKEVIG